jgi:4-amino-4-deoxy-L-arabinose transferase-like glycosyltransferase
MVYYVAGLYALIGRNMLATQLINAVLGAATAPLLFLATRLVFDDIRISRWTALGAAFMPSLILWSAQGLKDGPIMFLLALSILATLKLTRRFTVSTLLILIGALLGIMAFRFYVFYMLVAAIGGTLIIGTQTLTAESLGRQVVLLIVLGVAMSFFGAWMGSRAHIERYSSLQVLQTNRLDAATSAKSGFGKDENVSTAGGAVAAIPQGLVYLLLAPFPWQLGSFRQAITMPEMIAWWLSFPMFILGTLYSIKHRLRKALPILLFTVMLTLAYSVFQGNIGNAYRQRAQLLIFYFIFTAAGYTLMTHRSGSTNEEL